MLVQLARLRKEKMGQAYLRLFQRSILITHFDGPQL